MTRVDLVHVCFENPWKTKATGGALEMRRRIEAERAGGLSSDERHIDFADELGGADNGFARRRLPAFGALARFPLPVARRYHPGMAQALNQLPAPGMIVLEGFHMSWVLKEPWLRQCLRQGSQVAIRVHNLESAYHRGLATATTQPKRSLHYFVASQYSRQEQQLFASEEILFQHISPVELAAVREGLKPSAARFHSWLPPVCESWDLGNSHRAEPPVLKYFGDLSIAANCSALEGFIRGTWPSLLKAFPEARLEVAGRESKKVVGPNVRGMGYVPVLETWLQDAAGILVPNTNPGGIKVKMLDALSTGIPVVASQEMWREAGAMNVPLPEYWTEPMGDQVRRVFEASPSSVGGSFVRRHFSGPAHVERIKQLLNGV